LENLEGSVTYLFSFLPLESLQSPHFPPIATFFELNSS